MNNHTEPGYYLYHCPSWTGKMRVKVEKRRNGLFVRFTEGSVVTPMREIPDVAIWEPSEEGRLGALRKV